MLKILKNEPLSKYTTFHLGGPAKYFAVVKNSDELKEALDFAEEKDLDYFVLGGGSNLLFADGFGGLVIKAAFADIEIKGETMVAGAGAPLLLAVKKAAEAGLAGLENLAGIPGTIGGAVCNNAGAYGGSISEAVEKAELIYPEKKEMAVKKDWFGFDYRFSILKGWTDGKKPVLTRVWLKLQKGGKEELEKKIKEKLEYRKNREPKGFCAGCVFKNIKGGQVAELLEKFDFAPEERERFGSHKAIPAAWLIERAGLKGKKIGGAYIPKEHANYIINDGTAKSKDILEMISFIKQEVHDKFSVRLEEEVQIVKS